MVSGFEFRVSGFCCRVSCYCFQVAGRGFRGWKGRTKMGRVLSMPCREATRFCKLSKYFPDVAAVTCAKVLTNPGRICAWVMRQPLAGQNRAYRSDRKVEALANPGACLQATLAGHYPYSCKAAWPAGANSPAVEAGGTERSF